MTRTILSLALVAGLATTLGAQAQTVVRPGLPATGGTLTPGVAGGTGNIAARKQHMLAKIQEHMSTLQGLQSCVSAAQDATALRSCEEQARAARGAHEKKC